DVADDVHHLRDAGAGAALVDDGKAGADALGHVAGPHHAADIGGDHHDVPDVVIVANVAHHDRGGGEIVGWNVEEALDLGGMQVQRQDAVGAGLGDQVGHQLGGNRGAGRRFAV